MTVFFGDDQHAQPCFINHFLLYFGIMAIERLLAGVLSKNQKIVLVLSKSVSATLSLIASSIIIYKIYLRYKSQSKSTVVVSSSLRSSRNDITTYHRMLLGISTFDVIHSISSVFSSLLVPSYTQSTFAHGNTTTCSMQGAFQQLTPSIVIYMAMLNTYFMLKIRYNVPDSVINSQYEVWFHAFPTVHFLSTSITGLSMGIFGPIILPELGCWIDSYCVYTHTCTRSDPIFYEHLDYYAWSFAYIWLFVCVLIVSINAVLIYTAILGQEKRNARYLGARLQNEGQSGSGYRSTVSSSLQEFDVDLDDEDNEPEMAAVVHMKDHEKGNDFLMKNEIGTKSSTVLPIDVDEEIESPEQTPEIQSSEMLHPGNGGSNALTVTSSVTSRKSFGARSTQKVKQSRIAAVQSLLYVCSALFTAVWVFMPWVGNKLNVETQWRFFFAFMVNIVSPSQGIFSLFVFIRLQYLRLRESNKDWSQLRCVKECLFSSD
jgi:hypothetical protein